MNLLITGAWQQAAQYIPIIEKSGHKVLYMQFETDELPCAYDWADGVIANGLFLTHPIEKFTNLRYIQLTSAGYDRAPMDYIKNHNIQINNARGVYSIPMAESAICGVLQLYKKVREFQHNQQEHIWEKQRDILELSGKTVMIVGCGSVGNECAKRFNVFGCNVIGVDMLVREDANYTRIVSTDRMDEFLPKTDVIVLTLPLSDETRYFMDEQRFCLVKDGAVLVNIARGAVVDTDAIINHISRLCGAVLDVFENEPLEKGNLLWDIENVIITPHNSFVGENNGDRLAKIIIQNLEGK